MKKLGSLFNRIWLVLRHPVASSRLVAKENMRDTLLYFLLIMILPTLIIVIGGSIIYPRFMAPYLGGYSSLGWVGVLAVVIIIPLFWFIFVLISGLIIRLAAGIFGSRKDYKTNFKIATYSATPLMLSFWFPPAVIFTAVWSLILAIILVRNNHTLNTIKSISSVVLPIAIVLVLAVIIAALR